MRSVWAERKCKIMCKKLRARAHARTSDGSRQRVKHLLRGGPSLVPRPLPPGKGISWSNKMAAYWNVNAQEFKFSDITTRNDHVTA